MAERPRPFTGVILAGAEFFAVFANAPAAGIFEFHQKLQFCFVYAGFVINETVRIGHGQHLAAQFDNFFGAVLGDIAATGNYAVLVFNGVADMI